MYCECAQGTAEIFQATLALNPHTHTPHLHTYIHTHTLRNLGWGSSPWGDARGSTKVQSPRLQVHPANISKVSLSSPHPLILQVKTPSPHPPSENTEAQRGSEQAPNDTATRRRSWTLSPGFSARIQGISSGDCEVCGWRWRGKTWMQAAPIWILTAEWASDHHPPSLSLSVHLWRALGCVSPVPGAS